MASGVSLTGIGGSGLDTKAIIEQLIAVDSQPIASAQSRINKLKYKQDAWKDINSSLLALQDKIEALAKSSFESIKTTTSKDSSVATISAGENAVDANYNIEVISLAKNLVVSGDKFEGQIGIQGGFKLFDGTKTLDIAVESTDTMETLSQKINNSGGSISSYVIDNKLVFSHKKMGADSIISFEDTDGILKNIGVLNADDTVKNKVQDAAQSIFKVNGIQVQKNSNTVTDALKDVTIDLLKEGTTQTSVLTNTDDYIKKIEDFIGQYNNTMIKIDFKLKEDKVTASSAQLKGNMTLLNIKNKLRNTITSKMGGQIKRLYEIGIETSSENFGKDGTLVIKDRQKLKDALTNNKTEVMKFFIDDKDSDKQLDLKDEGLSGFLNNYIDSLVKDNLKDKGIIAHQIKNTDANIKVYQDKISRLETSIEMKRKKYQSQFLHMDKLIGNVTAQGNSLIDSMYSLMQ